MTVVLYSLTHLFAQYPEFCFKFYIRSFSEIRKEWDPSVKPGTARTCGGCAPAGTNIMGPAGTGRGAGKSEGTPPRMGLCGGGTGGGAGPRTRALGVPARVMNACQVIDP